MKQPMPEQQSKRRGIPVQAVIFHAYFSWGPCVVCMIDIIKRNSEGDAADIA